MKKLLFFFSLVVGIAAFSGCEPARYTVSARPSAPYYQRPVSPGRNYVWVDGDWNWQGGRYTYRNGYWSRPRGHHVWVTGNWEHRGNGYSWRRGRWK